MRYAFGLSLSNEFLVIAIDSLAWYGLVRTWRLVVSTGLVFNPDWLIVINLEFLLRGLQLSSGFMFPNDLWLLRRPTLAKQARRPMPELRSRMAGWVQGQQLLPVLWQERLPPDVERGIRLLARVLLPRYLVGLLPGTTVHDFLK